MKNVVIFILLVGFVNSICAQMAVNASFEARKNDTDKIKLYLKVARNYPNVGTYINTNADSACKYGYLALDLSKKLRWQQMQIEALKILSENSSLKESIPSKKHTFKSMLDTFKIYQNEQGQALCMYSLIRAYIKDKKLDSGLIFLQMALPFAIKYADTTLTAKIYTDIGRVYFYKADYTIAAGFMVKGVKEAETSGNVNATRWAYYNLIELYKKIGELELAIKYLTKLKKLVEQHDSKGELALVEQDFADVYILQKKYDLAIDLYNKSLTIVENEGDNRYLYFTLCTMAPAYYGNKDYINAIGCIKRAFAVGADNNIWQFKVEGMSILGKSYLQLAKDSLHKQLNNNKLIPNDRRKLLDFAIENLKGALDSSKKSVDFAIAGDASLHLSEAYELSGNTMEALNAYKRYSTYKDSTLNNDQKDSIRRLQLNYEFANKQDSIKFDAEQKKLVLEKDLQLKALRFEYEKKQNAVKSEKERQLLLLQESIKRQQIETNFAKKQAELVSKQQRKNLVMEIEKNKNNEALKLSLEEQKVNKLRFRQQLIIGASAFILILLVVSGYFFITRNNYKQLQSQILQQATEQKLQEALYKNKLNEVSFAALRSQMNPHFVFNCLNSINLYIQQNDTKYASFYLNKFASFIRVTLDSARNEKNDLAAEISTIKMYLEMEAMRFKDKLKYNIKIDKNVDTEFIEIPPLLIQPYIENAIWHGLMPKENGGKIDIHFSQLQNPDLLQITIADDGIGRKKSEALKNERKYQYISHSTQINKERIDIINDKHNDIASIVTIDLMDDMNNPIGTLVTIKLPLV